MEVIARSRVTGTAQSQTGRSRRILQPGLGAIRSAHRMTAFQAFRGFGGNRSGPALADSLQPRLSQDGLSALGPQRRNESFPMLPRLEFIPSFHRKQRRTS